MCENSTCVLVVSFCVLLLELDSVIRAANTPEVTGQPKPLSLQPPEGTLPGSEG